MKKDINEKLLIELYNSGKTDFEISKLMKMGERTVGTYLQKLRAKGKLKSRQELRTMKRLGLHKVANYDEEKKILLAKRDWELPKGTTKKEANDKFKIYLYVADTHIPVHNIPAIRSIHRLMEDVKFDGFRIVGDYMDMAPISHWNKHKRKTLETMRLRDDYNTGNVVLDEFDKRLSQNCDKGFFWGNHEEWYNQLIEDLPVLDGLLNPTDELHLKERGYKVYDQQNHIEKKGRLYTTHGIYATLYSVRAHIQAFKTNVLFFHTHRIESRSSNSPAKEIAIIGYNGGCLCNKNPEFLRNRPNTWSHGFAIVYYLPNGYFFVQNVRIIEGKFIYNGKLYDGNV